MVNRRALPRTMVAFPERPGVSPPDRARSSGQCNAARPAPPSVGGHAQAGVQRLGGSSHVVRVDEQRAGPDQLGGAGLAGEHERTAALAEHGTFLRDKVHAVPDRLTSRTSAMP